MSSGSRQWPNRYTVPTPPSPRHASHRGKQRSKDAPRAFAISDDEADCSNVPEASTAPDRSLDRAESRNEETPTHQGHSATEESREDEKSDGIRSCHKRARGSVGIAMGQDIIIDDDDGDVRSIHQWARGTVGIAMEQDMNDDDVRIKHTWTRGDVGTEMEQECSVFDSMKCPGNCGFYITWHATHCCNMCASRPGGGVHGPRCDRMPIDPSAEAFPWLSPGQASPDVQAEAAVIEKSNLWSQRLLELVKSRNGMHIMNINGFWKERWPDDDIEKFKPCKKMKAAVTRAETVDLRDDRVYLRGGDEEREGSQKPVLETEWAQRILELAREHKSMHVGDVSSFWKRKWPEEDINAFKPAKKMKQALKRVGEVELKGDYVYVPGPGMAIEVIDSDSIETDDDIDVNASANVQNQWSQRILELARESNGIHINEITHAWYRKWPNDNLADYRPCKKVKKAISNLKVVEVRDNRVYVPGLPALTVGACRKPFAVALAALEEVKHTVASGHRLDLHPDEEKFESVCVEAEEAISSLVAAVRTLLEGEEAIPLTNPEWSSSKVLYWAWAYAATSYNGELESLSNALKTAIEAVLGSAEEKEEDEMSEQLFKLWQSLLEQSIRVMPKQKIIGFEHASVSQAAISALKRLSVEMVPKKYKYSAHYLRLLYYERLEEIQVAVQELNDEDANLHASVYKGRWSALPLHRAELDLPDWTPSERSSSSNSRRASHLRKSDLVLLTPRKLGAAHNLAEGIVAEVRKDFEEGCPLMLKLWNISQPGMTSPISTAIESTEFTAVVLRSVPITFDRQVEAVKAVSKRNGRAFHPSIRDLIVRSWEDNVLIEEEEECIHDLTRASPKELAAELPDDVKDIVEGCGREIPLSRAQEQAVTNARTRRCSLVRGPPGTGKTHTACAMVQNWLDQGISRVLVVAQSNTAAFNIQERMNIFGIPCARVGSAMTAKEMQEQPAFVQALDEASRQLLEKEDPNKILSLAISTPMLQKVVNTVSVIVMTCISSGNGNLLRKSKFSRVLIDEAAQATEPTSLVPLMAGATSFVCIGDDKQLPATIHSWEAKRMKFDESLFERLLRIGIVSDGQGFQQLDIQRRMHSTIAAFPGVRFYGGNLENGCRDEDRPPVTGFGWPSDGKMRVCFVDMDGGAGNAYSEESGKSTRNLFEADLLVSTLNDILSSGVDPSEIAVITGYSAQRQLLRSKIVSPSIRVDTVDGFQGMERNVVLVSTVRSNTLGKVGFLSDERRANVLLTRARCGLIVFGSYSTLSQEWWTWRPWLDWIYKNGASITHDYLKR